MTTKIYPDSYKGRKLNKYLCMALLSGSVSWNFLDNVAFGIFVECLSNNRYKLPSRTYMTTCIVPGVYQACKCAVSAILQKTKNISFTTDAWRSFNKDSYITITAHVIDDDLELHSFVLDTSEIKVRHTAENLFYHINNVLQQWGSFNRLQCVVSYAQMLLVLFYVKVLAHWLHCYGLSPVCSLICLVRSHFLEIYFFSTEIPLI